MAARRGCMYSLWSGTERVRIGERLKATLAGVLELEVLKCKHMEMVDAALEVQGSTDNNTEEPAAAAEESGNPESVASEAQHGSATSRRQQVSQPGSLHDEIIKYGCRDDVDLPTSLSLRGSGRFFRCLVAHGCAELGTQLSQMVPETIGKCGTIILYGRMCTLVCVTLTCSKCH